MRMHKMSSLLKVDNEIKTKVKKNHLEHVMLYNML